MKKWRRCNIYQSIIKRVFDIVLSLLALPLLVILLIPVAILIRKEDGGPIFYIGTRLGKNMRPFDMYKFRSMKVNAPDLRNSDGTTFNSENDDRLTKIGRMLRKMSIDEIPQFINVLKGDMSIIGPRPSPLGDKSQYPPLFFEKYKVKPGITGYNQALLRNAATMEQRIENDAYYVEHISFLLDAKIFLWTIKSVLGAKNVFRA